ncbi:MAG: hypothetical protein HY973_00755, partial [Candidatus Kerfeldbacteria bacterium]|nr:hypothetical protein [Candidatus Kerfeldbacteria bacterium]
DSFYHTRLTIMLRDGGILRTFPWTQASLYQRIFIDHHFGYHLLLIPFLSIVPDLVGLKLITALLAALTITIIAWCLYRWRVPWWGAGVLLLLTTSPLLFRLSLGKVPAIGVGVAVLGYYLITSRKLGWLWWWSWFYTWLYSAWPLLLVLALVFIAVESATQANYHFRPALRLVLSPRNFKLLGVIILGCLAGLVINPYFPTNLLYLKQLFAMALTAYHKFLGVGAEWYPYNPWELVSNIALPLGVFILLTIAAVFNFKKQTILTRTAWSLAVIFLVYTLKARRQVEYLVPWLVMSSGLMWRDLWPLLRQPNLLAEIKTWLPEVLKSKIFVGFLTAYLVIIIPVGLWRGFSEADSGLRAGFPLTKYQGASSWLKKNTLPRAIIFQSDWSNFPVLWYNNQHNYYLTGLDQTFMYEYDRSKYWLWVAATRGERRRLYDIAKDTFKASYIMVDKEHTEMLLWLNRDKRFKKVYSDQEAIIYALDEKSF